MYALTAASSPSLPYEEPIMGVRSTQFIIDSHSDGFDIADSSRASMAAPRSSTSAIALKLVNGSIPPILSSSLRPRRISNSRIWNDSKPEAVPRPSLNARKP